MLSQFHHPLLVQMPRDRTRVTPNSSSNLLMLPALVPRAAIRSHQQQSLPNSWALPLLILRRWLTIRCHQDQTPLCRWYKVIMSWLVIKMIKRIKKRTISRCKMIVSWAPSSASYAGKITTWMRRSLLDVLAAIRLCAGRASLSIILEKFTA